MSHPRSAPAREERVDRAALPQAGLFSHPLQAEGLEQRPPLVERGEGVDWRAAPFSVGAAEQRRRLHADDED